MLVKMLVMQAGRDFVRDRGAVVEVADAEARRMIEAGIAEPVRVAPVERATPRPRGERAVAAS